MNVLKPRLQSTVFTLLERQTSQREIQRLTGVDRKTIRRYQAIFASERAAEANSPGVTTGSEAADGQTPPPPRPPAIGAQVAAKTFDPAQPVNRIGNGSSSRPV